MFRVLLLVTILISSCSNFSSGEEPPNHIKRYVRVEVVFAEEGIDYDDYTPYLNERPVFYIYDTPKRSRSYSLWSPNRFRDCHIIYDESVSEDELVEQIRQMIKSKVQRINKQ